MSHAQEPPIQEASIIRRTRRIPTKGDVPVSIGDLVSAETVVAKGSVTNPTILEVRVHTDLNVEPHETETYMLKKVGDEVKKDEAIAVHRSFFSRLTKVSRSPIDGFIESFSGSSGRALIRGKPISVEVKAHIPGKIVEIVADEGAIVESKGFLLEGVFGLGGEATGELALAVDEPSEALTTEQISERHKGKIIVGGAITTLEALRKAAKTGVNGIITGGIDEKDLTDFLGEEIGIGITGNERIGLTIVVTEGFGTHPMNDKSFGLLKSHRGSLVSIDGSTQIRSRMLRPEIVIPV